jgi:hypothetical protein
LKELKDIPTLKIFLAPLCREEIVFFKGPQQRTDLGKLLPDIMRRKLLRRTKRQKINPSLKDLETSLSCGRLGNSTMSFPLMMAKIASTGMLFITLSEMHVKHCWHLWPC